jgi:hypothetical protein
VERLRRRDRGGDTEEERPRRTDIWRDWNRESKEERLRRRD